MTNYETTLRTIFSVYFSLLIVPPHNIDITNDADADRTIYIIKHSFIHLMLIVYYNTFHHVIFIILNFSSTITFGDEISIQIPSTTKSVYSPQHEIQLQTIAAVTVELSTIRCGYY